MILHTANAARDGAAGPKLAYQRPFVAVRCFCAACNEHVEVLLVR